MEVELGNLQPTTHHRVPIRAWKVRVPQRNLTNEWSGDSRLGRGALPFWKEQGVCLRFLGEIMEGGV